MTEVSNGRQSLQSQLPDGTGLSSLERLKRRPGMIRDGSQPISKLARFSLEGKPCQSFDRRVDAIKKRCLVCGNMIGNGCRGKSVPRDCSTRQRN